MDSVLKTGLKLPQRCREVLARLPAPAGRLIDSHGDRPFLPFSFDNKRCMAHNTQTAGERVVRGAQNWSRSCKMMSGSPKDVDSTPAADFL
jgi:hypothetical protein